MKSRCHPIPEACAVGCALAAAAVLVAAAAEDGFAPPNPNPEFPNAPPPNPEKPPALGALLPKGEPEAAGAPADCAFALPKGDEPEADPNKEGAAAAAAAELPLEGAAAEDCENANGEPDEEAPNEGVVAPNGDGDGDGDAPEAAPPKSPLLPNVDDPNPPPELAAPPPKLNAGADDAAPNKLPPVAAAAGVEPNAGVDDVPNENDVGVLCDADALNPVNPDIVEHCSKNSTNGTTWNHLELSECPIKSIRCLGEWFLVNRKP